MQSFVTCSVGIWKVGLVGIGAGLVNVIVSFTIGRIVKYTGRMPIFLAGMSETHFIEGISDENIHTVSKIIKMKVVARVLVMKKYSEQDL